MSKLKSKRELDEGLNTLSFKGDFIDEATEEGLLTMIEIVMSNLNPGQGKFSENLRYDKYSEIKNEVLSSLLDDDTIKYDLKRIIQYITGALHDIL